MSVSIYFYQFKEKEVEQTWDKIMSGELETETKPELERLEREEQELVVKIPEYEDVSFLYYSKDPRYETYAKAEEKHSATEKQFQNLKWWRGSIVEFRQKLMLAKKFDEEIEQAIMDMNRGIIAHLSEQDFIEYYSHHFWDEYVVMFFAATLVMSLKKESFFEKDGIPGIPFELWVKAFKSADRLAMETIKKMAPDYDLDYDDFAAHILPVKNLVKFCLDTSTQMFVFFENSYSSFELNRAKAIFKKYKA